MDKQEAEDKAPENSEDKSAQAAPEGETSKPSTPPTPSVDVEAIKKQAIEEAKKVLASDKESMRKEFAQDIAKRITGEEDKKEVNPLVKALLTDPDTFFSAQHESLLEYVTKELEKKSSTEKEDNAALAKVGEEYPEVVKEHFDYLEVEFNKLDSKHPDKSRQEKIDMAAKNIAKKLKLKPVSERTSEQDYISAAYPSSGAASYGGGDSTPSSIKSAHDFINGRKDLARSYRSNKRK